MLLKVVLIYLSVFLGFSVILSIDSESDSQYPLPQLKHFPKPIKSSNNPTINGVKLGRYLFYDPILSEDSSISCGSCHKQSAAFSDSPNRFSKGVTGELQKRNTMPLFNLAWYSSFFWDGRVESIEEQVFHPVRNHNEMSLSWAIATKRIQSSKMYIEMFEQAFPGAEIDSVLIALAIAQFERTLISYNSKYDRVLRGEEYFTPDEFRGFVLINDQTKGDCLHCHTTDSDALGTTGKFSNNGLENFVDVDDYIDKGRGNVTGNMKDIGLFRIPSLRNIALTSPYMHDGRFSTLEEVLNFYSDEVKRSPNIDSKMQHVNRGGVKLTEEEKKQIISFLYTLTDSVFITNQEFSNPF